ncbi:MAG TPA: aminoglycoside phosphotransferase family protein [Casimicrobiaceae bacterium]|nr:aminoglycoside phosphotransferase family protein [Casimicrobiaceae bacterium]
MAVAALAGGVSSDIYRVDLPSGVTVCVKRALPKLKVAAEWRAPVSRNRWEAEWMRVAGEITPSAVPRLLGEDRDTGCFAMEFFPPERYPTWKALLSVGAIDTADAARVGDTLGRIHAATADCGDVAARFATDDIFYDIRLEPYLVATGRAHPRLAAQLGELVETTRRTKRTLVHGDFSPKNILCGPAGPVIVDAECAWFGDPAFDLAFVLNHLLLKGAWHPQWKARYVDAFQALCGAYFSHATWEPSDRLEARVAALLPALLLARIDGKSPVEYITEPAIKDRVRAFAAALLALPSSRLESIGERWAKKNDWPERNRRPEEDRA